MVTVVDVHAPLVCVCIYIKEVYVNVICEIRVEDRSEVEEMYIIKILFYCYKSLT